MKSRRTKALEISPRVKAVVWERDEEMCILCGAHNASPSCHFISRGQGGLGIEENIFTACWDCHRRYDQSIHRKEMREIIKDYLTGHYPNWDESQLYYRKDAQL